MTATRESSDRRFAPADRVTGGRVGKTFYHVAAAALTYLLRVHIGAVHHE